MTEREQIAAFAKELAMLVDRYRREFQLSLASAIGTLEVVKLELYVEQTKPT
jgi:hypothetical protein